MIKAYPQMKPDKHLTLYLRALLVSLLLFLVLDRCTFLAQASPAENAQNAAESNDADQGSTIYGVLTINDDGPAVAHLSFNSALEQKYNFPKVLSSVANCPIGEFDLWRDRDEQTTSIEAPCVLTFHRSPLIRSGTINLRAIGDIQRANPDLTLVFWVEFPQHKMIRCDPAPEHTGGTVSRPACMYASSDVSHTPSVIRFEYGYDRATALRVGGILGSLLLIPIALTFWFRRQAFNAPDDMKPAVLFAYRRFLTWAALLGILVWWAAIDMLHADDFLAFLLPIQRWSDSTLADFFPGFVLWIAAAVVYFVCLALSSPMQRLRGTTLKQTEILNRSFWAIGRFIIPLTLLLAGIAEVFQSPHVGVPLIAGSIIASRFVNAKFMRAYGMELHGLSSGELRDRAFAIAQQAKTRLNQLYVLPMQNMRVANAFAHSAQNIFLSDYLVGCLSKDEVDAVVAHEVTHLQKRHIGQRIIAYMVLVLAATFLAIHFERRIPPNLPVGPIFYGIVLLTLFFMSRRNEFAADAGAAKLTGNAEAMITALARITRLNTMPLQWSKFDEKLLTHPSTLRRIRRLASHAGISELRTNELLAQTALPPQEIYSIPSTALPAGKIFSTRYKIQFSARLAWAIVLISAIIPGIVASGVRWFGFEGYIRWAVYIAGFLITLGFDWVLLNYLPMIGNAKMESRLREKCRGQQKDSSKCAGLFVGLAPDSSPRIYEANWNWDFGFLSLGPDSLRYWGEEAQFVLPREQITSISFGPGSVGWLSTSSIYLSWRDAAGNVRKFNIRPLRARSMRDTATKTKLLMRDLEGWRNQMPESASPVFVDIELLDSNVGPPSFGQVTGMSPRMVARGRFLVRDILLNIFVAVLVIAFFGLGLSPLGSSDHPSSSTNTFLGGIYVLLVVLVIRIFLLTPYWRARENGSNASAPN